jgi:hypothetical protein
MVTLFISGGGVFPADPTSNRSDVETVCSGPPAKTVEDEHRHRKPVMKIANHRKGAPMTEYLFRTLENSRLPF